MFPTYKLANISDFQIILGSFINMFFTLKELPKLYRGEKKRKEKKTCRHGVRISERGTNASTDWVEDFLIIRIYFWGGEPLDIYFTRTA